MLKRLMSRVKPQTAHCPTLLAHTTALPKGNLVPGRLELTVKFSKLPKPLIVQSSSIKIGIETGERIVIAILTAKLWKKLEQAAKDDPQWVAASSGSLDQLQDGRITLKRPAIQVFKKKAKPAAEATPPLADTAKVSVDPPASALPKTKTPVATPASALPNPNAIKATLSLKGKKEKLKEA
ncbi:MAG: hypothetical protein IPK63_10095 [Candidatus Competibacteraceae bacterium]|nr:hypothetical protein [Candidatus Competibacteraceae bacterium]